MRNQIAWINSSAVRAFRLLLLLGGVLALLPGLAVAQPAPDANSVLILSSTDGGGMYTTLAAAQGFTVVTASDPQWTARTTADFATFKAIILGDPTCSGLSSVTAAQANAPVWAAAIDGPMLIIGTDENYHAISGGQQFADSGISFVTSGTPGQTGAYISLSCYYENDPPNTPVPLLAPFGVFTVGSASCYNDSHIVAVHPALSGSTDATLSNWSCSVHEFFNSFPSPSFLPLAIAENATGLGQLSFADGTTGIPYILARGGGVTPINCGNGILESPEQCDDGNTTSGDGCSSVCLSDCSVGIGRIDVVPAATLLLPYFEVDLANPYGVNTLFSINNAYETAVLAHVTVWTDQSIPALDFDVYLTGYDVQAISLRDIFVNGNLPITASAGQDLSDIISPKGPASQDINFASCSGLLPYATLAVSPAFRAHLQAWFQGNASPATGNCAGSKRKDNIARGYITVDTVNACNLFFPSDFAFYAPFLTNQNVLWGDVIYVDPSHNFAEGENLVHIEACATSFAPGDHTFYGRYNNGSAADAREPLPTTMGARFLENGGETSYLVWREGNASAVGYPCALQGPASWYPLDSGQIVIFDEEEQPVTNDTVLIPNEAQRISVAADLLSPFNFGWVYMNLQHSKLIAAYGDPYAQTWALVQMIDASGRFTVGYDALQLDNANRPITKMISF